MPMIGGQHRKYTKEQMGKLRADNLVGTREAQQFEDAARNQAQAGLQAQQTMLNRAGAANKAGSPVVAGAIADAAKEVSGQTTEGAVKASGQKAQFTEALKQQRAQQALNLAQHQMAVNRADLGMVLTGAPAVISSIISPT